MISQLFDLLLALVAGQEPDIRFEVASFIRDRPGDSTFVSTCDALVGRWLSSAPPPSAGSQLTSQGSGKFQSKIATREGAPPERAMNPEA